MAWTAPFTWLVGTQLPAAKLNEQVRDNLDALAPDGVTSTSWTPIISGSTSGISNPADVGRRYRIGPMQFAAAYWLSPNQTMEISGNLQVALPAAASGIASSNNGGTAIGQWRLYDSSAAASSLSGSVFLAAAAVIRFGLPEGNRLAHTLLDSPGTGDLFSFSVWYPVA